MSPTTRRSALMIAGLALRATERMGWSMVGAVELKGLLSFENMRFHSPEKMVVRNGCLSAGTSRVIADARCKRDERGKTHAGLPPIGLANARPTRMSTRRPPPKPVRYDARSGDFA